ncbi:MAG: hypothetical protein WDO14_24580 [Bacteroidota bacterium]
MKSIIVLVMILLASTTNKSFAQYIQFSSAGQTNNADSIYNGFAAKHKPQINQSLYRNKLDSGSASQLSKYQGRYDQSVGSKLGRYNKKYDSALGRIQQYRLKYNGVQQKLNQQSLTGQLNQFKSKYALDERFQKVARYAPQVKSFRDQLFSGKLKIDSGTVFNNRIMQSYMDSIQKKLPPKPVNPFQQVSQEQLVKQVNDHFRQSGDSIRNSEKWIGSTRKKIDDKKQWANLNYTRLKTADKDDLKPLMSRVVDVKALKHVDSARAEALKSTRTKLQQEEKNANEQVAKFRKLGSFWQKSYLEGILSLATNQSSTMQFSPAWAYHIVPSWSVGGGPNLMINRKDASNIKVDVGARILTKYEILHRTTYFQVEDRINPSAMNNERNLFTQHSVMAGGGYVLPFLSPLTLNLSVMYRFYSNGAAVNDRSNWVFRVGISTNKKPK